MTDKNPEAVLKPCPFCGAPAKRVVDALDAMMGNVSVTCSSHCGARQFAVELWNTRAAHVAQPQADLDIEALKVIDDDMNQWRVGWNACLDHLVKIGLIGGK